MFFSFDHPADFAISLYNNPDTLHFGVDTDIVEWEPNVFTFITDSFMTVTNHLVVEIGLCGCTRHSNYLFEPIFLNSAVILIYCLRWATTQNSVSSNAFSSISRKW